MGAAERDTRLGHLTFGRRTGLRVSEYALGTVNFGGGTGWGEGTERAAARRIFDRFAEAGGTFIDTADCYHQGEAERMLGEFLGADRDHFVVATKFGYGSADRYTTSGTGNGRKNMRRSVEASLRRLGTDHVDLFWVHFPDAVTPIEEILRGLDDLVHAGKVLYAGLSNFPAWRVSRADAIAALRGWSPIAGIQIEYSLADRSADRELLPMAESLGLGAALWSPLAGGLLTGKYRIGPQGRLSHWNRVVHTEDTAQKTAVLDRVVAIAGALGVPPGQVAMAWLRERARRAGTALVPVLGPRTLAQLDQYLAALSLSLTDRHVAALDEVSAVPLGTPHQVNTSVSGALLGSHDGPVRRLAVDAA